MCNEKSYNINGKYKYQMSHWYLQHFGYVPFVKVLSKYFPEVWNVYLPCTKQHIYAKFCKTVLKQWAVPMQHLLLH